MDRRNTLRFGCPFIGVLRQPGTGGLCRKNNEFSGKYGLYMAYPWVGFTFPIAGSFYIVPSPKS